MRHLPFLFRALLVSAALLPLSSLAQTTAAPNFERLRHRWVQELESQDLDGSLALYAKDATFTNPDGTHVSGVALRNLYKTVFESFRSKILMNPRSKATSGSLAYEAGSYAEDLTAIGTGTKKHVTGDYLTVYRREDSGAWLIVEQVWTQATDSER